MSELLIHAGRVFTAAEHDVLLKDAWVKVTDGQIAEVRSDEPGRSPGAEIIEAPRVLLTTSCTDALELAAMLLGLGEGDEVIVPSFTFVSGANAFAIRGARRYLGDRLIRVATPHRFLDQGSGPLIAVRLRLLTRKTLGGIETDLDGRVLGQHGRPLPGLYAAGEVAGFGGGGMHGYRSLEGTFLGGCLFSGRVAGRAVAAALS